METQLYVPYSKPWRTQKFIQLLLSKTKDNVLSTVVPARELRKTYIFRLPDELLNEVVRLALPLSEHSSAKTYTPALILAVICKRFNQLAIPLLYHDIHFDNSSRGRATVPPQFMANKLHRTMKNNPALRLLCRSLRISVHESDLTAEDFHVAVELLFWLKNVKSFGVHGGFTYDMETWPMLYHAFKSMPLITKLAISRCHFTLSQSPILAIKLPNLQSLKLHGVGQPTGLPSSSYVLSQVQQVSYSFTVSPLVFRLCSSRIGCVRLESASTKTNPQYRKRRVLELLPRLLFRIGWKPQPRLQRLSIGPKR
jgi:hypothetical protein